jgi:hypothetical protein
MNGSKILSNFSFIFFAAPGNIGSPNPKSKLALN